MGTIQQGVDYMIVNYNSGLAWAVQGNQSNYGTSVVQYSWVIDPHQYNQRWSFEQVQSGWLIRTPPAFGGGLCAALDPNGWIYGNNVGVNVYLQQPSYGIWTLSSDQVGEWISITNQASGKCCVVQNESLQNDAAVVQYDPIVQAGQRWVILPYIPGLTT